MKKILILALLCFLIPNISHAATFSDVPETHPDYAAAQSLKNLSIVNGFPDGTFQPQNPVTRAEALKMILLSAEVVVDEAAAGESVFSDVTPDAWFVNYNRKGKELGIVKGYGETGQLLPNNQVTKAEFLKMIFQAFETDLSKHQNSTDVSSDTNAGEWYLPFLSYAKTIGVITPTVDNRLEPNKPLTRADCAQIIYKLLIIERGGETQKLLNISEANLVQVLVDLNSGDINAALKHSGNAVFFTEQALEREPEEGIVKAANKIAQGVQKLSLAYKAGRDGEGDLLIQNVNEAKQLAGDAFNDDNSVQELGKKIKSLGDALLSQVQQQIINP
jgi:hypothetical protein